MANNYNSIQCLSGIQAKMLMLRRGQTNNHANGVYMHKTKVPVSEVYPTKFTAESQGWIDFDKEAISVGGSVLVEGTTGVGRDHSIELRTPLGAGKATGSYKYSYAGGVATGPLNETWQRITIPMLDKQIKCVGFQITLDVQMNLEISSQHEGGITFKEFGVTLMTGQSEILSEILEKKLGYYTACAICNEEDGKYKPIGSAYLNPLLVKAIPRN